MCIYIRNEPVRTGSSFLPPRLTKDSPEGAFKLDRNYFVVASRDCVWNRKLHFRKHIEKKTRYEIANKVTIRTPVMILHVVRKRLYKVAKITKI